MSYTTCRNALLTQLQAVANFSADNVKAADYDMLNSGVDRGIIVVFDSFMDERRTYGRKAVTWRFQLHIVEKVIGGPAEVEAQWAIDGQAIIDRIDSWPKLNNVVEDAHISEGKDTLEEIVIGGVRYFHFDMLAEVREESAINFAE